MQRSKNMLEEQFISYGFTKEEFKFKVDIFFLLRIFILSLKILYKFFTCI